MEITVTEAGASQKNIKVTIPAEDVQKQYNEKIDEIRKETPIKGFRPGRVPKHIVIKKFGKRILDEIKFTYILDSYREAIEKNNLHPLREPELFQKIEEIELKKDEDFVFEFPIEVLPEFDLPDYKKDEFKPKAVETTDEDVEKSLIDIRKMRGELNVVENESSKEDDYLVCDVNIKCEENLIWGKENYFLEVKDTNILGIPIEKALLEGRKQDEECKKEVTFPKDFQLNEYREMKGEIFLKVLEIKRIQLPPLDDELAKEMGCENLEDLKTKLKAQLLQQKEMMEHRELEEKILGYIVEEAKIDLPDSFVQSRVDNVHKSIQERMEEQGKEKEEIDKYIEENKEKNRKEIEDRLKESLIIEKVAHEQEIEVPEEELDAHIEVIAAQTKQWPNQVREEYKKRGLLEDLEYRIKRHKVLEYMRESQVEEAKDEKAEKKDEKPEKKDEKAEKKDEKPEKKDEKAEKKDEKPEKKDEKPEKKRRKA